MAHPFSTPRTVRTLAGCLALAFGPMACKANPEPEKTSSQPNIAAAPAVAQAALPPRTVILGFDGLDPRRVDSLIKAGRMPHFERVGNEGHRGPLGTTNPPQSPVAWASFATGARPGHHGIFDFVRRDAQTYMPAVATTTVTHARLDGSRLTPANAENLRHGDAFWDVIGRAGVAASALTVPYAYPPPATGARQLAGLGTPDVRGTNSSFTWLTTDAARAAADPPAGGEVARLDPSGDNAWQALIDGPIPTVDGARKRVSATVLVRKEGTGVAVEVGAQHALLEAGETSPMMTLEFVAAPLLRIKAATRFTLRQASPPEIYAEPLSIVPDAPYLPLASPAAFAMDLWQKLGPFKTVGWVDDTSALGAGVMDEAQFLREAITTMKWQQKALSAALREGRDQMLVAVFTAPDRIEHMFYRAVDDKSPVHADAVPFASAIDDAYVAADGVLGAVAEQLRPQDTLLVMSDHGFSGFRRGLNLNRWLVRRGYMKLKPHVGVGREFFADVDWAHTRAYAFGTGGIYLNFANREARGVVASKAAPALARKIAKELKGLRDGDTVAVLDTYLGDDLYTGMARGDAPDVRVAMAEGYRASWGTTLGAVPVALFEDNMKKWSGDHASARPEDVPGILLSNRGIEMDNPRIEDLARTAYELSGVPPPQSVEGRALLHLPAEHAAR